MKKAYLALGSNLGDRLLTLQKATALLEQDAKIHVLAKSKLYETLPYGEVPQDNYLNAVLQIETAYEPFELLALTQEIEKKLGRERLIHWGPRTLDIDILLLDGVQMNTPTLTIPHAEMFKRSFVLIPLADVYEENTLQGKTFNEWIEATGNREEVLTNGESW
jgi:2-amino-4-hydroxy-6-hydroxymethyldihydropteridine diphosphokinase